MLNSFLLNSAIFASEEGSTGNFIFTLIIIIIIIISLSNDSSK